MKSLEQTQAEKIEALWEMNHMLSNEMAGMKKHNARLDEILNDKIVEITHMGVQAKADKDLINNLKGKIERQAKHVKDLEADRNRLGNCYHKALEELGEAEEKWLNAVSGPSKLAYFFIGALMGALALAAVLAIKGII